MKKIAVILASVILLISCKEKKSEQLPQKTEKPPVAVSALNPKKIEYVDTINVDGELDYKFSTEIKSEFTARVTNVYVNEWIYVKKGQQLIQLDTREIDATVSKMKAALAASNAAVKETEVSITRAEREYQRTKNLFDSGLATRQQMDDSATEKDASAARLASAKAQLAAAEEDLKYQNIKRNKTTISSPMNGIISLRDVNPGDVVDPMNSKILFKIVDPYVLNLTFNIPSDKISAVKKGKLLQFTVDSFPDKLFEGKIMFINPQIEVSNRTLKVIAEVNNKDGLLKGGMFTKGKILTGEKKNILITPKSAVIEYDQKNNSGSIYEAVDNKAVKKDVKLGVLINDDIEIKSGIDENHLIIFRGSQNIKNGDSITIEKEK